MASSRAHHLSLPAPLHHTSMSYRQLHIKKPLQPGSDGGQLVGNAKVTEVLRHGQQVAFALITFNQFWSYVIPIFGAIVADVWLHSHKAICYFSRQDPCPNPLHSLYLADGHR